MGEFNIKKHLEHSGKYSEICREERNIVAIFYHLLMNEDNFLKFIKACQNKTNHEIFNSQEEIEFQDREIYYEYSYLRDLWYQYSEKEDNEKKKELIKDWFSRNVDTKNILDSLNTEEDFNKFFGCTSKEYIQYPGSWRVLELCDKVKEVNISEGEISKESLLEIAKFKWSFNIKPDLVIILDQKKVLCFEAKFKSGYSSYPHNPKEKKKWDEFFGIKNQRVSQLELQEFLFKKILNYQEFYPFSILNEETGNSNDLLWKDVFNDMEIDDYSRAFLSENKFLNTDFVR